MALTLRAAEWGKTALLVSIALFCGCRQNDSAADSRYPEHDEVARFFGEFRPLEARISGSHTWSECSTSGSIFALSCDNFRAPTTEVANALDRMKTAAGADPDGDDRSWSLATLDLASHTSGQDRIDNVINRLTDIVKRDSTNGPARNDLAVSYRLRAEIHADAASLFESLDQIERAADLSPTSPFVVFNRALILERLHLDSEAALAWNRYRKLDKNSAWIKEVQKHERLLSTRSILNTSSSTKEFSAAFVEQRSTADYQALRESVTAELLPKWAALIDKSDQLAADAVAHRIDSIGSQLATTVRDSSVAHLAALTSKPSREIARGIVAFDSGSVAFRRGDYTVASTYLTASSKTLSALGAHSLVNWAQIMLGFAEMYGNRYAEADARLRALERAASARTEHALRARAHWGLGLSAARQGKTAEALDHYVVASGIYETLHERTNEGVMLAQSGDVLFLLGRDDAAMRTKIRALEAMTERGDARARTGALIALGRELTEVGLAAAGAAMLREAVTLAPASTRVNDLPEALIRLSDAEVIVGRTESGKAALKKAQAAIQSVNDATMRPRLQMELDDAQATLFSESAPIAALDRIGMVESYYRQSHLVFDFGTPLLKKARLELRTGDTSAAIRDLQFAAATIKAHSIPARDLDAARDRAAARREVYGELTSLAIARFDTAGAFFAVEQGRGNSIQRVPVHDAGHVTLSYVTLADQTLLWVIKGSHMRMVRIAIGVRDLNRQIDDFELALRRPALSARRDSLARQLYITLVAPVAADIENTSLITIVPTGKLGRLSFAGLRDSGGHSLIEKGALMYAGTVSGSSSRTRRAGTTLVVGNPLFDQELFAELSPLPEADRETSNVAALWPSSMRLTHADATKQAVLAALSHASILHFSGHARLVERMPRLSHLVLARSSGGVRANSLAAEEISALDLRTLQLAILSACGTTQRHSRRNDSESGLASAFLSAGTGGVISSLWEVDDKESATLMAEIHAQLRAGKNPADALRQAQLRIQSLPGTNQATWASFRYETR